MSIYEDIQEELLLQIEVRKVMEIKNAIDLLEFNGYTVVKAS